MVKFVLHFLFLAAGVAYLARRSERFYWQTLGAFCGGIALNALYGVTQLAGRAGAGPNLDQAAVAPLTGGGARSTSTAPSRGRRSTGRTRSPATRTTSGSCCSSRCSCSRRSTCASSAGTGCGCRSPRCSASCSSSSSRRSRGAACSASRSASLVLALPYRRHSSRRRCLVPLGAVAAVIAAVVVRRWTSSTRAPLAHRTRAAARGSAHFEVYEFIPDVLSSNPLFGLGLNNFSVYYEFVTGKTNLGPHSFYVALLVETGIVGTALFALFVCWLFRAPARRAQLGRALAAARRPGGRACARSRGG